MVTIEVLESFYDLATHKLRTVGETFEATERRASDIDAALLATSRSQESIPRPIPARTNQNPQPQKAAEKTGPQRPRRTSPR